MNPFGFLFIAVGVFSLLGSICDWEWFMNSRKGRRMVKLITRTGARILYGVLGLGLVVVGVLALMGIITMKS